MSIIYNRIALIGLGLIASSIAYAARAAGSAATIVGYDCDGDVRSQAGKLGFCDTVYDNAYDAVKQADLVVLATPVGAMADIVKQISPHLKQGAVLTDVGSVKRAVIDAVAPLLPDHVTFIPAHPLAGTEHSGPGAGFAQLFDKRWCLLTPIPVPADNGGPDNGGTGHNGHDNSGPDTSGPDNGGKDVHEREIDNLRRFWQAMGANVELIDPDYHDLVLAVTSHTPHLIAYTMVGVADDLKRVADKEVINYSAAGFRDFTRIAASDPTMWRDVFLNNKGATLEILGRFTEELFALQRAIRTSDGDFLLDYFTRTRAIRRGIIDAGQDTDAPNFGRNGK